MSNSKPLPRGVKNTLSSKANHKRNQQNANFMSRLMDGVSRNLYTTSNKKDLWRKLRATWQTNEE